MAGAQCWGESFKRLSAAHPSFLDRGGQKQLLFLIYIKKKSFSDSVQSGALKWQNEMSSFKIVVNHRQWRKHTSSVFTYKSVESQISTNTVFVCRKLCFLKKRTVLYRIVGTFQLISIEYTMNLLIERHVYFWITTVQRNSGKKVKKCYKSNASFMLCGKKTVISKSFHLFSNDHTCSSLRS